MTYEQNAPSCDPPMVPPIKFFILRTLLKHNTTIYTKKQKQNKTKPSLVITFFLI